jgi:hypothetical protein
MSFSTVYSFSGPLRATLKILAFVLALFAAVFSASAGYGLLKMLLEGMSSGSNIGVAEFSTHSGLTLVFFVLAALGAYAAKKCYC